MKKIQIFIEHDIIIRHFIFNHTFKQLEDKFHVQYILPNAHKRIKTDIASLGFNNYKVINVNDERLAKIRTLSKIQTINVAHFNKKFNFVKKQWYSFFGWRNYVRLWLKSLPIIFPLYKKKILKEANGYLEMQDVIDDFKPDLIIHPSVLEGLFITDLCAIGKKRKIPVIALMNSWDNPSTKALVLEKPDKLVVWGEQTKQHAVDFMSMSPENVNIFGAAQFESYKESPTKSRDEICNILGIERNKKIIIYAGSSKSVNEINHLQILEKEIANENLKNCHVIFRPHPWRSIVDDEEDFYDINFKFISMDPFMKSFYNSPKRKTEKKMHLTNYIDTHNILSACDMLISNMSTILLEAAVHGKPVLCMVSDEDMKNSNFLQVSMNALYLTELMEGLMIPRCSKFTEIAMLCESLLKKAEKPDFSFEQQNRSQYFVLLDNDLYSNKLRKLIDELLKNDIYNKL